MARWEHVMADWLLLLQSNHFITPGAYQMKHAHTHTTCTHTHSHTHTSPTHTHTCTQTHTQPSLLVGTRYSDLASHQDPQNFAEHFVELARHSLAQLALILLLQLISVQCTHRRAHTYPHINTHTLVVPN